MHPGKLPGDGVLRSVLLLRQPLDPPDLGEEPADLFQNVLAILLGHNHYEPIVGRSKNRSRIHAPLTNGGIKMIIISEC